MLFFDAHPLSGSPRAPLVRRALAAAGVAFAAAAMMLAPIMAAGCASDSDPAPGPLPDLRINEIVSNNEGVDVDEFGETDDYIEIYNAGTRTIDLADYHIDDNDKGDGKPLPSVMLSPGAVQLLWADKTPEQGKFHLPFKISASGDRLRLLQVGSNAVDRVEVPALDEHHAFVRIPDGTGAFTDCGWATPARPNGDRCGPPPRPELPDDVTFAPFSWPVPWPAAPQPLVISEAALKPAAFVELWNSSDMPVDLGQFSLRLAHHGPGVAWPDASAGTALALPARSLMPGERIAVTVSDDDLADLASDPNFEGVLTIFASADGTAVDRVDFMSWPDHATLARFPEPTGPYRFCSDSTPGAPNTTCTQLASRPAADRMRRLLTPDDFHALAAGRTELGTESVEFIVDMDAGDVVTFLNSADWDLHYTFIREIIDKDAHLDRCDPAQRLAYDQGWYAFSQAQYFQVDGRRYLLGTLVRHAGSQLATIEFAPGDLISADQMKRAFFTVMAHVYDPTEWVVRPQTPDQIDRIRAIEGQLPIVGPNAPFQGLTLQPLSPGVAYGTLQFVAATDLNSSPIGLHDIVITDQVPNDIPLIGGLVTESFQTPLAHVNILSRGRRTPNMALRGARTDPRVAPLLGKLVRLEVTGTDFTLAPASADEALAFWNDRKAAQPPLVPRLDTTVRGVQPLSEHSLADIPYIGGKAAQMAELGKVILCSGSMAAQIPSHPFAIPVVHSLEHFEASGARALLDDLQKDPAFFADPLVQKKGLAEVRDLIMKYPVDPELLDQVVVAIGERWPGQPLRFRSSSNTEDLVGFNGAGLYTSAGTEAADGRKQFEDAIRIVWASLWNDRAYAERDYDNVAQDKVAMGVLVHPAFESEKVNGVAISRDALNPSRADRYYVNAQVGEALVTNPAPGIASDEFTYSPTDYQKFAYYSKSTFSPDAPVLSDQEAAALYCNLSSIHEHFRPLLDPNQQNPWFAMDIEFKLLGPDHSLLIKQARPYSFGVQAPSGWCDF